MGADLSRIRSNPLLDYAGVELKQGGVLLDADFNELVAVTDRRIRAAASDILGRSRVSSTTTDAFKISVAGGALAIGKGRMYVDGLLAECHGGPTDPASKQLDPSMAETTYPNPLTYATQPFFATPPALPAAGKHLVYLDVWEREVTHLESPALVESAVNVETSSRRQVVWQVRVLGDDAGGSDCSTEDAKFPGWAGVIAPSAARLTTGTYDPPPADDPCELPPTGGYRGLENQTYRVEIQDDGLPGAGATFKWSRDNASVGSRVTVIAEKGKLEAAMLGRDDVLRFNTGDWVEIIDDLREQSRRCGELRRVTVDDAARTIAFAPDLPADMLPPAGAALTDPAFPRQRNLRVRRWDHNHQVMKVDAAGATSLYYDLDAAAATGAIPVPAAGTTIVLESGITVQFAAVGTGHFRAGDYWVFAARTSDASVEILRNEPPRGIHHHYARLGIWNVGTGQVSDCRLQWPPDGGGGHDCSCTQCVTPESHANGTLTIQTAVNNVVQRGGGTVCIAIGQYTVDQPVLVQGAKSMRIRGEGAGTVVTAGKTAFAIADSTGIVLEDMAIVSAGSAPTVQVRTGYGILLQRLLIACFAAGDLAAAIGLGGVVVGLTIRENMILAPDGIVSGEVKGTFAAASALPDGFLASAALRIEDNLMYCLRSGIRFTGPVIHLLGHAIEGNEIVGAGNAAIRLLGIGLPGASSMQIRDNDIAFAGSDGIAAAVDGLWIEGNRIAGKSNAAKGAGIRLTTGLDASGPDECIATGNQVTGFGAGGIVVQSATRELVVKQNLIAKCGMGISVTEQGGVGNASIDNNHVSDVAAGETNDGFVAGISIARAESASACGNIVCRIGQDGAGSSAAGISAIGVERVRLAGNDVTDIGPAGSSEKIDTAGIQVGEPFASAIIEHNQVERETTRSEQPGGNFIGILIGSWKADGGAGSIGSGTHYTMLKSGEKAVFLGKMGAYVTKTKAAAGNAAQPSASIAGNTVGSRGSRPAVRAVVKGDCLFGHNRCEQRGGKTDAVQLAGNAVIVDGNRVRSLGSASINIDANAKTTAVLGNVTTRPILIGNAALAVPWAPLNVVA